MWQIKWHLRDCSDFCLPGFYFFIFQWSHAFHINMLFPSCKYAISYPITVFPNFFPMEKTLKSCFMFARDPEILLRKHWRVPRRLKWGAQNISSWITVKKFYILKRPYINCGPVSSVGIAIDYGLDGLGSNPGGDEIFHTCPDRPWVPPSLL